MKPQRHAKSSQCPICKEKWALQGTFVQLPNGATSYLGVCDKCDYCPNLSGYLRQVPGGFQFEPLNRSRRAA